MYGFNPMYGFNLLQCLICGKFAVCCHGIQVCCTPHTYMGSRHLHRPHGFALPCGLHCKCLFPMYHAFMGTTIVYIPVLCYCPHIRNLLSETHTYVHTCTCTCLHCYTLLYYVYTVHTVLYTIYTVLYTMYCTIYYTMYILYSYQKFAVRDIYVHVRTYLPTLLCITMLCCIFSIYVCAYVCMYICMQC
jgi:hypothetical protein